MGFIKNLFINKSLADACNFQGLDRDIFFSLGSDCKQEANPNRSKSCRQSEQECDRVVICFRRGQALDALNVAKNPEYRGKTISFQLIDD